MNKSLVALSISLILGVNAYAENPSDGPPPTAPEVPSTVAGSSSDSSSISSATGGNSVSTATGVGGSSESASDANATATGGASSSGGNTLTVNSYGKRSAPSVFAPSVFPTATCQGAFSIGGSGVNGGGALGFGFTKKECSTVVLAQNLAALGLRQQACEALMSTPSAKRVWPEAKDRICDAGWNTDTEEVSSQVPVTPPWNADMKDLERLFDQKLDRAFRRSTAK